MCVAVPFFFSYLLSECLMSGGVMFVVRFSIFWFIFISGREIIKNNFYHADKNLKAFKQIFAVIFVISFVTESF